MIKIAFSYQKRGFSHTMFSFKQLEAIYWIDREGSFGAAALRLHTSQAAVSKRVKELESLLGDELFDRSLRHARLTEKGQQVLLTAQRLLAQRDAALESLVNPEAMVRRVRIGITELVAMTWLPRLLGRVRAMYPQVTIEPDVDSATRLRDKLQADALDLVIVPDAFSHDRLASKRLQSARFTWMCKPGLVRKQGPLSVQELASHTLLMQGDTSGLGVIMDHWLNENLVARIEPPIITNSLLPLIGLTVAGMGVSYMPLECLQPLVDAGALQTVDIDVPNPEVPYAAVYKPQRKSILVSSICLLAQECGNFSRMFDGI
ncbi:LysR family transcriptional regulator [Acidovorax soli]